MAAFGTRARFVTTAIGREADMSASVKFIALTKRCARVAYMLPGVRAQVSAPKPEIAALNADTLGAKLKRRRFERGLRQRDAAREMGVNEHTVIDWERGKEPMVANYPVIILFLGYEPWSEARTRQDRLKVERRRRGWSIKRTAYELQVAEDTFAAWERGRQPMPRFIEVLSKFISRPSTAPAE